MAIGVRATGTAIFSAATMTAGIPTAQVTGDMMLLLVTGKPFDAGWSVPAGWTSVTFGPSGSTAAGVDTGSMKGQAWYREALSDTETDPVVTEGSPVWNVTGAVVIVFSKDADETWSTPVGLTSADETTGTALSFSYIQSPGLAPVLGGDYICQLLGMNTDALGPLTSPLTPTHTGITFGTTTGFDAETTTGGDMALHVSTTPAVSGTSSGAPTAAGTGTASGGADRALAVMIRLRVTGGGAAVTPPKPLYRLQAVNRSRTY